MVCKLSILLALSLAINSSAAMLWLSNFSPQMMQLRVKMFLNREQARMRSLNNARDLYTVVSNDWKVNEEHERPRRTVELKSDNQPEDFNVAEAYRQPSVNLGILFGRRSIF
ncbi:hypothetical protein M3Y98_01006400 [Aphelenchoides besseyi]|nr:hypothetical protein M3Y98_01006400 [Aphelenchoides besseyi]KAI6195206.1 hypothetical protein M3Y96_01206300 [Aphelenchoides besseyi]